jgi:iron complex outermembrane receptor protein
MLNTLTASSSTGALNDIGGGNSFSPGASQASLRNLGAQSTLVLLNGRRIAMYPLANYQETFSNLDSLPLEAVDRIEILKSGGGAIYGSDAIAGVINIITKNSFQGFEISGSTGHSLKTGKFGEKSGAVTFGFGDYSKSGWNVLGNIDLYHRDNLFWSDILDAVNPKYKAQSPGFGTFSTYSYPGNIIGQGALDGCTGVVSPSGLCTYNRYSRFEVQPEAQRANMLLSGNFRINADTALYSELLYSKTRTTYQNPYAVYGALQAPVAWVNSQTGEGREFDYMYLPPTHPLNQTGDYADFRYRFVDSGASERTETTQYRFLTGLKGTTRGWDYDTAVGVMGGTTHDKQRGGFSASGFTQEIGAWNTSGAPDDDFFNKPGGYVIGGNNSATVLDTLFPTYGYLGKTKQEFWDGNISTDLSTYDAGTMKLSTGFELRHESMVIAPTNNLYTGDIVGYGVSKSDAARSFGAVFAELSIPMTKSTEGSLALRADKYPNLGAHLSPKAGIRFQAASDLMFRATAETGFRAPNLQESAPSAKTAFQPGIDDPRRCPAAQQLSAAYQALADSLPDTDPNKQIDQALADTTLQNECGASVAIYTVNNPNLKPETSKSFTMGSAFQITKNWGVTVDYWNITRRNEINLRSVQELLTVEDTLPTGIVVRGGTEKTFTGVPGSGTIADPLLYGIGPADAPLKQVNQKWENLFSTHTSGIDFSVKGSTNLGFGARYATDIDATWTMAYKVYSPSRPNAQGGTGAWGNNLSRTYGYPEWQLNWTHSIITGPVTNSLRWVHSSSQDLGSDWDDTTWDKTDCLAQGYEDYQCKIAAYNRFDWDISWQAWKGLSVGAHVFNVFQQRPPVDLRSFGGGIVPVSNEDASGRSLKLWANWKF